MVEMSSGLIKLKKGSEQAVENWKEVMSSRSDEVHDSMCAEEVHIESWFEIEINGDTYLQWYMSADSIDKAVEIFHQSTKPIDKFHLEFLNEVAEEGVIVAKPIMNFIQ